MPHPEDLRRAARFRVAVAGMILVWAILVLTVTCHG